MMILFLVLAFAVKFDLSFTTKNDLEYKVSTDKTFTIDIPFDCSQVSKGKKCGLNCCRVKVEKGTEFVVKQPKLDLMSSEISQEQQQVTIFRSVVPPMSIEVSSVDITVSTRGKIVQVEPKPASQKSTKVAFNLSKDQDFIVHFENSNYGPIVESYTRKVYIEQYSGVINVFNKYLLNNRGSKLDYFNRADYMRKRESLDNLPIVKELLFTLPGGAKQPWVRDDVGNISTSNFRSGKSQRIVINEKPKTIKGKPSHLRIKPRYPVFGGWKFDFGNGYFLDTKKHMITGTYEELIPLFKKPVEIEKTNTNSPHYFYLNLNLADLPKSLTIEEFTVEIVLPEGAHHIHVQGDVDSILLDVNREFSYFDALGRRKLVLKSRYLQRDSNIKILYAQSPFDFKLRKLTTISLGLIGVFTSLLAISRVNLSLK